MTTTTRNTSLHVERVEMPAAANLVSNLKLPLRTEARESFLAVLDAECGQLQRAVTEQHYSTVRNAKDASGAVNRTSSILFGQANKEKSKAIEVALVLSGR